MGVTFVELASAPPLPLPELSLEEELIGALLPSSSCRLVARRKTPRCRMTIVVFRPFRPRETFGGCCSLVRARELLGGGVCNSHGEGNTIVSEYFNWSEGPEWDMVGGCEDVDIVGGNLVVDGERDGG